MKQEGNMMKY